MNSFLPLLPVKHPLKSGVLTNLFDKQPPRHLLNFFDVFDLRRRHQPYVVVFHLQRALVEHSLYVQLYFGFFWERLDLTEQLRHRRVSVVLLYLRHVRFRQSLACGSVAIQTDEARNVLQVVYHLADFVVRILLLTQVTKVQRSLHDSFLFDVWVLHIYLVTYHLQIFLLLLAQV